jgi:hypothetical protein
MVTSIRTGANPNISDGGEIALKKLKILSRNYCCTLYRDTLLAAEEGRFLKRKMENFG